MLQKLWSMVLLVAVLAACGNQESAVPAQTAPVVTTPPAVVASAASDSASAPAADAEANMEPNTEEKVLNIYNWPDYVPEGMIAAFEKETGIKVNYDTFETNEALHAKLVAGNTGYDIVVPGSVFAKPQIEGGLLQPLQKGRIKNLNNLDPGLMATLLKADPDNKHLVPWAWSFTTVGWNKTKALKALGNMPMPDNAWDLVFQPEYTKKLKSCGIAYLDSPTEILPAALHYIGKDAYSNDPADYKLAAEMLAKVRPDVRIFSSTMIDDLAGGKACVVIGWAGDINIAARRAKENQSKDDMEALLPSGGALIFFDTMAITKDAKHPKNAHAFIDFYLRPENSAWVTNAMNYPTANRAAVSKVNPDIAQNKTIFVPSEYFPKMVHPSSFSNEAREALASTYNAFKKGK
ncbi:extracellular solute-binding protein [Candidatus Symbiobacter mobilis]|uniref:Putrescine-binding periplasmic protein n=1 Tax=Candidatus Symbiobacter mobilis CR TaxID=946483 RepID=U5NDM0_9BURK|nr:extracellular solute-binding protein [Candidatus Symbiobacter mobilis]AGX88264.1 putrescine transport system substrate-binding protein [Candidatus Symbiobacter mobilis CR]